MGAAVEWLGGETPYSPRFGDVFHSETGGLAQARHVFLQGCGLPQAWRGQHQWRILETGFGLGLNFLATWQAWRADPQRPRMLHFVSIEAWPVDAADLLRSVAAWPDLVPLAEALMKQWHGLLPGFHRLAFDDGHVLLTLCIGDVKPMLRELRFAADSVYLDGFTPERNPDMWDTHTLQSMARCCRRGTGIATWSAAGEVKQSLRQCGFDIQRAPGLPPKWHRLTGEFNPAWEPKARDPLPPPRQPGHCVVIGAGLAGAAVAASLARRGWQVKVMDAAESPAAGASGLPAGILAPHVSPDDAVLSRLTRCGIRITLQHAAALLQAGVDWELTGVLERRIDEGSGLPDAWPEAGLDWTRPGDAREHTAAGLPQGGASLWHLQGGWIKPARLIQAWLAQPGISWQGKTAVAQIEQQGQLVHVLDAHGARLGTADLVVLATGPGTASILAASAKDAAAVQLQPVRGQVSIGVLPSSTNPGPGFPVNGHGSFIPRIPSATGECWLMGATFDRGDTDMSARLEDHEHNLGKLRTLLPEVAAAVAPQFSGAQVQAWVGVRCTSPDRLPAVGTVLDALPGLQVCTAMGSRGLVFAALCAELLAARLHGEPLPLGKKMAGALDARRLA